MTAREERPAYHCPTCREARGDRAYCAPARCLCGHKKCPAYPSYTPVRPIDPKTLTGRKRP